MKPLEEFLASLRDIDGFPIANDENILALSDTPFYTACPNPYIREFIEEYGIRYDAVNDDYNKKPFVINISEGKDDKIYRAHSYHTKVPHKAIIKFIEHYTEKGDIVFDGFCGSGMTGIAAQMTGRKAIISDLSPAATFIAYSYTFNSKKNLKKLEKEVKNILDKLKENWLWMYETSHSKKAINTRTGENPLNINNNGLKGIINYVIWSDILICPYCENEYIFWDAAVNKRTEEIADEFDCPNCNSKIKKSDRKRSKEKIYDSAIKEEITQVKSIPVIIDYNFNNTRFRKTPDKNDLEILSRIKYTEIPYWFPIEELPDGVNTKQPKKSHNINYNYQFYTKRALWIHAAINDSIKSPFARFVHTSILSMRCTNRMPYRPGGRSAGTVNNLSIPAVRQEYNVIDTFRRKANQIIKAFNAKKESESIIISTNSITDLNIKDNSVDYIFTDPPFGKNIMYSEISYLWESWLKVFTNNKTEAIENKVQKKTLEDYADLMTKGFKEMHRILKPNRWITIVFHNSKAAVWNAIRESINKSGFIIAQVTTLDKKQGSFKQVTSPGAVQNDLIINAYKPEIEFSERFIENAGENMEIEFIKEQLEHLPIQPNIGRREQMLNSKMLAHYIVNGFKIKYDFINIYNLLSDNFTELDGYWFLDNQIEQYNEWKSGLGLNQIKDILSGQQVLIVSDEKTAIIWIYNFLPEPKDYNEIFTAYQQVSTPTTDKIPELKDILDNNFILENGKYRRPHDQKEHAEINKNREKELDRAFEKLLLKARTKSGKIKEVRKEALLHGFTKCYQEEKYQDILTIADKLYVNTLDSLEEVMDFVDIARIKTSGQEEP